MLSSLSSLRALCLRLKSPLSLMAGVPTASLSRLFLVMAGLACVVFLRSPSTDFIFDEQEALLASDYLAGSGSFLRAFSLDFWGLSSDRSIGS